MYLVHTIAHLQQFTVPCHNTHGPSAKLLFFLSSRKIYTLTSHINNNKCFHLFSIRNSENNRSSTSTGTPHHRARPRHSTGEGADRAGSTPNLPSSSAARPQLSGPETRLRLARSLCGPTRLPPSPVSQSANQPASPACQQASYHLSTNGAPDTNTQNYGHFI